MLSATMPRFSEVTSGIDLGRLTSIAGAFAGISTLDNHYTTPAFNHRRGGSRRIHLTSFHRRRIPELLGDYALERTTTRHPQRQPRQRSSFVVGNGALYLQRLNQDPGAMRPASLHSEATSRGDHRTVGRPSENAAPLRVILPEGLISIMTRPSHARPRRHGDPDFRRRRLEG